MRLISSPSTQGVLWEAVERKRLRSAKEAV